MIAMQYSFTLPADYDMAIIDRRIADKGHMTDGFPGLLFKAYLVARADPDNLYAPFYVWRHADGMNAFLTGPGFVGLTRSFGWPVVRTWSIWRQRIGDIGRATHATREITAISPHADLAALRDAAPAADAALAEISGFEPTTWTAVRFRLWGRPVAAGQAYGVGHVSI